MLMEEARYNIAISNLASEIDRRCMELTHPIPEDRKKIIEKLRTVRQLLNVSINALESFEEGSASIIDVENIGEYINKLRIKEYENEKAERER